MTVRAETLAPQDQRDSAQQPYPDSPAGADPVIFKRIFKKIRNTDEHRSDTHAIQPILPDLFFQIAFLAVRNSERVRRSRGRAEAGHSRLGLQLVLVSWRGGGLRCSGLERVWNG